MQPDQSSRAVHCPHRGSHVCQEDYGNASHFKCPYHGWVFKNDGSFVGAPEMQAAYGGRLNASEWGLRRAPKVDSIHGFIFACLSEEAESLRDCLGGAAWMFDAIFGLHPDGVKALAPPERFILHADWKSGAENFVGDTYHIGTAHHSVTLTGYLPGDVREGGQYAHGFLFENGHEFLGYRLPEWFGPPFKYWGFPEELASQFDLSAVDETQRELLVTVPPSVGTIFPNFSYLRMPEPPGPGEFPIPNTDIRVWSPIAPGVMEVWHWQFNFAFMPEEYQRKAYLSGQYTFGAGGIFEQDDMTIWEGASKAAQSPWNRKVGAELNYQQKRPEPNPDWKGPGQFFDTYYGEYLQAGFWKQWLKMMRNG